MRLGADRDQELLALENMGLVILADDLDPMRIEKTGAAAEGLDRVAGELVLQHVDLVLQRHVKPAHQVAGADILFHPIGAAIEAALPPAGEIEDSLAESLGRDRAGMDGDAADFPALLDHQHGFAELCRLNGTPPPGGPAADHDEIVGAHGWRRIPRLGESRLTQNCTVRNPPRHPPRIPAPPYNPSANCDTLIGPARRMGEENDAAGPTLADLPLARGLF